MLSVSVETKAFVRVRRMNLQQYSHVLDSFTHIKLPKFDDADDSYNFEIIFIHENQARSISIICLYQTAQLATVSLTCVYLQT